jgi:hypothetical protein
MGCALPEHAGVRERKHGRIDTEMELFRSVREEKRRTRNTELKMKMRAVLSGISFHGAMLTGRCKF